MSSLSVKDRAKMFGDLASPSHDRPERSYHQMGNVVTKSPFKASASPRPKSVAPAFLTSNTPKSSVPFSPGSSYQKQKLQTSSFVSSPGGRKSLDWPVEDGIPVPSASKKKTLPENMPPAILPSSKRPNSPSPFKVLQNKEHPVRQTSSLGMNKATMEVESFPLKILQKKEKQSKYTSPIMRSSAKLLQSRIADPSSNLQANISKNGSSGDNENENKNPTNDSSHRGKSSRALRLMRAKRNGASSPSPLIETGLKQCLKAAKVVMQEEKSEAGASDVSSRSSLSNMELSEIATRALKISKNKMENELNETKIPISTRSSSKTLDQDARRALLNLTMMKKKVPNASRKSIGDGDASERLGVKASRAVAMKNSTKRRGASESGTKSSLEIQRTSSLQSNESSRSRRSEHPALASRPSPRVKKASIVSSAHILASFRQFNASRNSHPSHQQVKNDVSMAKNGNADGNQGTVLEVNNSSSLESAESLDQNETMHSISGRQAESMHSTSGMMHSTSGRSHFYQMGRLHVTARNNCNDTCVSSLSSNTNQSIMSQSIASRSIASKMKSPANKRNQNSSFLLDPTPEYSTQTMRSEMSGPILSPGPSNRSGHSFANSIISASPRAGDRSPTFSDPSDSSFMDALLEMKSSSQESTGCSAELLDAALLAAVEDMEIIDSPKKNPNKVMKPVNTNAINKKSYMATGMSILPSTSGRSHSPPGFVFNDSDETDVLAPPDPVGKEEFALADAVSGPEIDSEEEDNSFDVELKQGILKIDSSVDIEDGNQNNEVAYQKQGSNSTKQTASTSIRSGMSSIQNGPVILIANPDSAFERVGQEAFEGSTSIRTGLSGLKNDTDNSISIHTEYKNDVVKNTTITPPHIIQETGAAKNEGSGGANLTQKIPVIFPPQIPDTIQEENEVKSTQKSTTSTKEEQTSFSGLKVKYTATTDESSAGKATGSGGSSSYKISSDDSGNDTGFDDPVVSVNRNLLPPIQTEDVGGDEASNNGTSLLTPASRGSRAWQGIGNVIKSVLAKASPRAGVPVTTPSGFTSSRRQELDESESLFSLDDDDDDDIFGGLEDNFVGQPKILVTPKKKKIDMKTSKQKNVKSSEKNKDSSRRSNESAGKRKTPKSGTRRSGDIKISGSRTPSSPSAAAGTYSSSLYSNDRSGTVVDESEVVHNVNSDITSSLIGGPISAPNPFRKAMTEATKLLDFGENFGEKNNEMETRDKMTKSPISISKSSKRSKTSLSKTFAETTATEEEMGNLPTERNLCGNLLSATKNEAELKPKEEEDIPDVREEEDDDEEKKPVSSMFLNFGCGFVDPCGGFTSLCTPASKVDDPVKETVIEDEDLDKTYASVSSHSRLTSLEKKVWNEWDRLNDSVMSPKAGTESTDNASVDIKDDHDKKREAARDKLLDIASVALSSHISGKSGESTIIEDDQFTIEDDQFTKNTITEEPTVSASGSTESGTTKESDSGTSGHSSGTEESGDYLGSSSEESSHGYSTEYSSGLETDFISEGPSHSSDAECVASTTVMTTPTAGPILLSFSQRSLMEKFSKQLTAVGVQVLKLNTRKQWQTRYFTVSNEQIALSAHEAISKTGEIAQCPKALLWLKKFNPKTGGYGIMNIDKNGHGGMLLVDLVDIQVSDTNDDMLENPIPKKLMDKFQNSVLVTLKYKMSGFLRSIEFRCKDNDEAQFLCTCMRVIRDLLRRERSLRQKLSKQESNKKKTQSSFRKK